jgi:hypothetical protein
VSVTSVAAAPVHEEHADRTGKQEQEQKDGSGIHGAPRFSSSLDDQAQRGAPV